MDAPLGVAVGNALEVIECIDVLKGGGPQDLIDVSIELTARMLVLGKVGARRADAERQVARGDRLRRRRSSASARSSRHRAAIRGWSTTTADCRTRARRHTDRRADEPAIYARSTPSWSAAHRSSLGAGRDRVEDAVDPAVGIIVMREARRPGGRPAIRCSNCTSATQAQARRRAPARRPRPSRSTMPAPPVPRAAHRRRGPLMHQRSFSRSSGAARHPAASRYAFSNNRRAIDWTTVAWGLGLQVLFAFIVLKTTIGQRVFETLGGCITGCSGSPASARRSCSVRSATHRVGPGDDRRSRAGRRAVRGDLRVSGAADDHLHRRAVRDPLLLRRDAVHRPRCSRW